MISVAVVVVLSSFSLVATSFVFVVDDSNRVVGVGMYIFVSISVFQVIFWALSLFGLLRVALSLVSPTNFYCGSKVRHYYAMLSPNSPHN